jgi:type IV secretory pathway VirB2 component (pilin)
MVNLFFQRLSRGFLKMMNGIKRGDPSFTTMCRGKVSFAFSVALPLLAGHESAWASSTSSNLPFTSTLDTLKEAISGPFLMSASIIMIVVTCLMLAFGEWGDGFKKFLNIAMWLSIAFGVTTTITTLFGSGAVV